MSHRSRIAILSSIGLLGLLFILWKINSSPIDKRPIVEVPSSGTTLAWDTEGNRLAIANTDGRILIWDKSDNTYVPSVELSTSFRQSVMALAWSPDSSLLAGGDFEGHILIWDMGTERVLQDIIGDGTPIDSIVWSPNGDKIAVSNTRNVVVWDVINDAELLRLETELVTLFWTSDENLLIHYERDLRQPTQLLNVATGEEETNYNIAGGRIALSPGRTEFVGRPGIWDISTGQLLVSACDECSGTIIWSLDWSPDGQRIASGSGAGIEVYDFSIHVWDATTGQSLSILEGHTDSVIALAWHPDSNTLTSVSFDQTVRIWDVLSGRAMTSFHINDLSSIRSIALTPDGQTIAVIGGDGITRIWDLMS